jgi:hypothetical protein
MLAACVGVLHVSGRRAGVPDAVIEGMSLDDLSRLAEHERSERKKATMVMALFGAIVIFAVIAVIAVMGWRGW